MIEGLSHITFITMDLARMTQILTGVFDAREVYASGDQQYSFSEEKFFLIGDLWIAVMKGEALPARSYNHIAFKIAEHNFDNYAARITALGLEMRPPRPRIEGEGRSLYFYDDDNHLFELHTGTLEQRLQHYAQSAKG